MSSLHWAPLTSEPGEDDVNTVCLSTDLMLSLVQLSLQTQVANFSLAIVFL